MNTWLHSLRLRILVLGNILLEWRWSHQVRVVLLSLQENTLDLLSETSMLERKHVLAPIDCNHKLGRPSIKAEVNK